MTKGHKDTRRMRSLEWGETLNTTAKDPTRTARSLAIHGRREGLLYVSWSRKYRGRSRESSQLNTMYPLLEHARRSSFHWAGGSNLAERECNRRSQDLKLSVRRGRPSRRASRKSTIGIPLVGSGLCHRDNIVSGVIYARALNTILASRLWWWEKGSITTNGQIRV